MAIPMLDCAVMYTDQNGDPVKCLLDICDGAPPAMTLAEDRTWRCDECGCVVLSWRLSGEHLQRKEGQSDGL